MAVQMKSKANSKGQDQAKATPNLRRRSRPLQDQDICVDAKALITLPEPAQGRDIRILIPSASSDIRRFARFKSGSSQFLRASKNLWPARH
jgi:hypothetical protein